MMRFVALMMICVGCAGAGNLRSQARSVSNRAAIVVNAGTHQMLERYCSESMGSIGREGTLIVIDERDRCIESGPRRGSAATAEELAGLELIRSRWASVVAAAEIVVLKHAVFRLLISAAGATDGQILAAVGDLVAAYESMRQAAVIAGISPPPALRLE